MSNEETIFAEALGKDSAAERSAYLDHACGVDAALRRGVDALLLAHERAGGILESAPTPETPTLDADRTFPPRGEGPGSVIGPYKLLEQIGEGGMGVVFLAEQSRPIQRKVALKIIKPGMDSGQVIARFEAERQALAVMDHANIAKVLDAGTTDSGRPYFVMELVGGIPFTEYCDRERLTPRQRLELFVQVCHAVQHAHTKGIIHRDLKPTNVLVAMRDGKPMPKVIDFGVAKAIGQPLTEHTLFTPFVQMIGTPLYMSPEQAQMGGLDVDTRSDVYSLGVLLYELLTGSTPFDGRRFGKAALDEIRRIIREEEPPKPSTRLSASATLASIAAHRGVEPRRLSVLVHGELDWIVMKALDKDRTRRYETASALGDDVDRYLADDVVVASPPSKVYRFRRFVRRNKAPMIVSAVVFVVLLAGVIGTATGLAGETHQRAIAEEQRREAQRQRAEAQKEARERERQAAVAEAVTQFQSDMLASADPGKQLGDKVTVLQAVTAAVRELDAGKLKDQPLVEAKVREVIGATLRELGRYDLAEPNLGKAVNLRRGSLPAGHPDIATSLNELALLRYAQRKLSEAEALDREALEIRRKAHPAGHPSIAVSLSNLAGDLHRQQRFAEAEPLFREALEIYRRRRPLPRASIADNLGDLGIMLLKQGRAAEAEPMLREVFTINRAIRPEGHPDIAWSLTLLAFLSQAQGNYVEAERLDRRALEIFRKALPPGHPRIAWSLNFLAVDLRNQGNPGAAEPLAREALGIRRRAFPAGHSEIAESLNELGSVLEAQGKADDAAPLFREARVMTPRPAAIPSGPE